MQRPPYALRPELHPLARALREHLARARLLDDNARLVLALSGGLDSVVLLHLLRFGRVWKPVVLVAAHFDHAMRPGSDRDAQWVRGLCHAWGIALEMGRANESLRGESAARAARYRFLHACAQRIDAPCMILTAHHANDQAETVLMRLVRGTDMRGLAGIRARRASLVRPLLPFERAQIETYARDVGLEHRIDPTNDDVAFTRNRIRHEILPRLESLRGGVVRRIARVAQAAAADEDAWTHVIAPLVEAAIVESDARTIQLARPVLLSYHPRVRARVLRNVLQRTGCAPDHAGTQAVLEFIRSGTGEIELAGGLRIASEFDRLVIRRTAIVAEDRPLRIPGPGNGSGELMVGGRRFAVDWTVNARHDGAAAAFDLTALCFPLELRAWTPGDRIRLDYGSKKLKKLFVERRIPRRSRAGIPVLADAAGRVVWVMGVARAAALAPHAGRPALQLAVRDAESI